MKIVLQKFNIFGAPCLFNDDFFLAKIVLATSCIEVIIILLEKFPNFGTSCKHLNHLFFKFSSQRYVLLSYSLCCNFFFFFFSSEKYGIPDACRPSICFFSYVRFFF